MGEERTADPLTAFISRSLRADVTGIEGPAHRLGALGLHADHARGRPDRLDGQGDPRDEPAAADGHHYDVAVRHVLEQLHAERGVAGDHVIVVEGM